LSKHAVLAEPKLIDECPKPHADGVDEPIAQASCSPVAVSTSDSLIPAAEQRQQ
jgi:hypothetical protein